MAIVFALRSDNASYLARYSAVNLVTPTQIGAGVISYDTDATAIGGNSINMDQGSSAVRILQYPFNGNLTSKAFSIMMRVKMSADALIGYFSLGQTGNQSYNNYALYQNSSLYQMLMFNNAGTTIKNGSTGVDPSVDQWDDICITWDGTTTANKLQFWVNGSATQFTASAAAPTTTFFQNFCIGGITTGVPNARMKVNEVVIWNEEINPTSVTLTSGAGSLDGPTRTAFVEVAALVGGAYTNPGVANVLASAGTYVFAGATLTPTYVPPAATNIVAGIINVNKGNSRF